MRFIKYFIAYKGFYLSILKNLFLYLIYSLIIIISYVELSHFWVSCGGLSGKNIYIELPTLILLLLLLYFPQKNLFKNIILSIIPILGLYILYDIFYHFLSRSPRISDLENANLIGDFSPIMSVGLGLMLFIIIGSILYLVYSFKKNVSKKVFYSTITIKVFFILGLFYYLSHDTLNNYILNKFDYYCWSQSKTIKKNGRFSSFIYYGLISNKARKKLALYKSKKIDINKILFGNLKIKNKKNIYIVILESFVDPRLIKNVSFSQSPLYPKMNKYLDGKEFSYIISSIYGGGTPQSEFEVLTAVPALSKVSSIEFNVLGGKKISGFVNLLKDNGYNTHANIATFSSYYNSKDGYKSIGFDKTIFLEESDDFKLRNGDKHIFDGDVYTYNIQTLKKKNLKSPYLLYTLGMYGHFPYDRNLKLRPDVITTTHKDKRINKVANQFYYRTKALADYIENILSFDPNSIIFVTSDHLPPLFNNGIKYSKSQKENIALLLVNGKKINIDGLHYYDIPRVILQYLNNDNKKLSSIDSKTYKDIYFKELSESFLVY